MNHVKHLISKHFVAFLQILSLPTTNCKNTGFFWGKAGNKLQQNIPLITINYTVRCVEGADSAEIKSKGKVKAGSEYIEAVKTKQSIYKELKQPSTYCIYLI